MFLLDILEELSIISHGTDVHVGCSITESAKNYLLSFQERRMAMGRNTKQTSAKAATAASKVLRDKRTGKASKTAAGSALSQTPSKKPNK